MREVSVLGTTLLQAAGTYQYEPLDTAPAIAGLPHYVGHPATRFLLDAAGAVYTPGYFNGLQVGEAFYVAQLINPRKGQEFTKDCPNVTPEDIKWGRVTRLS